MRSDRPRSFGRGDVSTTTPHFPIRMTTPRADSGLRSPERVVWIDAKYKAHLQLLTHHGWTGLGVYFGEGPAASRLPAAFVAERRKNLERVRGQTSAMRAKVLSRLRVELEKAGKAEDAAMVGKLVEIYEHAASLGQDPRSGGTMSAASREAFSKAFEKKFPGALPAFAAAMASKDPTKVRAALRKTAAQVLDVARMLGEAAPAGGSAEQQIVVDTAVHLAWILPVPPLVAETATGLGEDQLVALLTTAFGC